mmetsp:Transcript_5882/g.9152  ORF Transcript_5882/g.9152 Transcript_5882/m.9152 type:complete len:341 (+) Transcript_5882:92-1114(+)
MIDDAERDIDRALLSEGHDVPCCVEIEGDLEVHRIIDDDERDIDRTLLSEGHDVPCCVEIEEDEVKKGDEWDETAERGIGAISRVLYFMLAMGMALFVAVCFAFLVDFAVARIWEGFFPRWLTPDELFHEEYFRTYRSLAVQTLILYAMLLCVYFYALWKQMPSQKQLSVAKEDEMKHAILTSAFLGACLGSIIFGPFIHNMHEFGPPVRITFLCAVVGGTAYGGVKTFGKKATMILIVLWLMPEFELDYTHVSIEILGAGLLVNIVVPLIDVVSPVLKYIAWDKESLLLPSCRHTSSHTIYQLRKYVRLLVLGICFSSVLRLAIFYSKVDSLYKTRLMK